MVQISILRKVNEAIGQLEVQSKETDKFVTANLEFHPLPFEKQIYREILGAGGQDSPLTNTYYYKDMQNLKSILTRDRIAKSPRETQ